MRNTDADLREMLAGLLSARTTSAKDLARRVGCDTRAAEHYRAGRHAPPLPVFIAMCRALGSDLAEVMIAPDAARARLEQELRDAKAVVADLEARRRAVASGSGLDHPRPAPVASAPPADGGA